jgi:hypothetical protein
MPFVGKETMKNFERKYQKFREARLAMQAAGEKDFPVGVEVFYDHGEYERSGVVNMNSGDRVRITTPSKKDVWIDCVRITRVMA